MAEPSEQAGPARRDWRPHALLLLAGSNLTLIQYVALKELASLIGSNEIVALIVLAGYFLGLSFGYLYSDRPSRRGLALLGVATLALHLSLPFSARWLAATMSRINLGGNIPPFVFLLSMFGITPFYAVFLPRLIDRFNDRFNAPFNAPANPPDSSGASTSLTRLYATEIAGGIVGLLIVVILSPARIRYILTAHLAGLVVMIAIHAGLSARRAALLAIFPVAYFVVFPPLDRASLSYFYRHTHQFKSAEVIASEFSPYQRVDLIRTESGKAASDNLYLNGNLLYGSRTLHQHNLFVSLLPNIAMGKPTNAVVIAGGSLDAARYLAPRARHLTVVEIDEAVTRITRKHIQEPRGGFPTNWDLVIDDGKHFLGAWTGEPFDVISVDVPVPTHLQTAMLHAERFFQLAHDRLAPGGTFSISLSGSYDSAHESDSLIESHLANRIMAGLYKHFRRVDVVLGNRRAFAYASDRDDPLDEKQLGDRLEAFLKEGDNREVFGSPPVKLMEQSTARERAQGFEPIGEADMQIVLRMSLSKLYHRYYEPND